MKKRITLVAGLLTALVFVGCGGGGNADYPDEPYDIEIDDVVDDIVDDISNDVSDVSDDVSDVSDDLQNAVSEPVSYVYSEEEMEMLKGEWTAVGEQYTFFLTFYDDCTFRYEADMGMELEGTFQFNGTDIWLTFDDGAEAYFTLNDGVITNEDGLPYYKMENQGGAGYDNIIFGYWDGVNTPPNVWFIFTDNFEFYCNRDKDYLEQGSYVLENGGVLLTYFGTGETEFLLFTGEQDLDYPDTNGLRRTNLDYTVPDWVLEQFE